MPNTSARTICSWTRQLFCRLDGGQLLREWIITDVTTSYRVLVVSTLSQVVDTRVEAFSNSSTFRRSQIKKISPNPLCEHFRKAAAQQRPQVMKTSPSCVHLCVSLGCEDVMYTLSHRWWLSAAFAREKKCENAFATATISSAERVRTCAHGTQAGFATPCHEGKKEAGEHKSIGSSDE